MGSCRTIKLTYSRATDPGRGSVAFPPCFPESYLHFHSASQHRPSLSLLPLLRLRLTSLLDEGAIAASEVRDGCGRLLKLAIMDGVSGEVRSDCPLVISHLRTALFCLVALFKSPLKISFSCARTVWFFFQVRGLLEEDFEVQSDLSFKSKEIMFHWSKERGCIGKYPYLPSTLSKM